MNRMITAFVLVLIANSTNAATDQRWYSADQVSRGETVFQQNCAGCHGSNAEATPDWKKTDANGNYPPPPLNGTAHAWHHDLQLLRDTIRKGGARVGGVMPAFENKLSDAEIDEVIAFFQSKWPDDIYDKWSGRFLDTSVPSISDTSSGSDTDVTRYLRQRMGGVNPPTPTATPVEGVWQVKLNNGFVYLLQDGQYALLGDLIDLKTGQNVTEQARGALTRKAMDRFSDDQLVVYQPTGETKATLNVFTDTACPYCRKLHSELPQLLAAGIRVRYFPYPRGGKTGPAYQVMRSVWCASDRNQAMDDAKKDRNSGLPAGDCALADAVDRGYETGNEIGVTGTPTLYRENGEKLAAGYVPYKQLIPMLIGR